jgi:hypothetical protein
VATHRRRGSWFGAAWWREGGGAGGREERVVMVEGVCLVAAVGDFWGGLGICQIRFCRFGGGELAGTCRGRS